MLVVKYNIDGSQSESGTPENTKSIYTMVGFFNKIPKAIRIQIKTEELAGTPDVLDWTFIVSLMTEVDLNALPDGFVGGLNLMVANPNININQNDVNDFLEI